MPIINSLLDNDYYKYSMAHLVLHQHPGAMVEYAFKCRNGSGIPGSRKTMKHDGINLTYPILEFMEQLDKEIDHLCTLQLTDKELKYLSDIPYFKDDYIEYLRLLKLNRKYVNFWVDEEGQLQGRIKGPWISTIWFEVPILAIISELNSVFDTNYAAMATIEGEKNLKNNIELLKNNHIQFTDFGTRRRYSFEWQTYVIEKYIKELQENILIGTSNVLLATKLGIKPIGTMAHELFQAFQQLGPRLVDHQAACLDAWAHEYRGQLGIALSDIVGFDSFLNDFDLYFAKLFDGCRHDSGDPYEWGIKLIKHYKKLGIDPLTKTAVFSDGLDIPTAIKLHKYFNNMINVSFGIGTNLVNDMGKEAPQIVIKMVKCNDKPTAKISDSAGKGMCEDPGFLLYLKQVFNIP